MRKYEIEGVLKRVERRSAEYQSLLSQAEGVVTISGIADINYIEANEDLDEKEFAVMLGKKPYDKVLSETAFIFESHLGNLSCGTLRLGESEEIWAARIYSRRGKINLIRASCENSDGCWEASFFGRERRYST